MVAVEVVGAAVSAYLAAFQYGLLHDVWDPIFAGGSRAVLTSALSRMLPVRDAALGGGAYLVEAVLEVSGGSRRWHDRPWLVLLLGVTAGVMALTSLGLIVVQAAVVGQFCTLCLASAGISLVIPVLVWREVRAAVGQVRAYRRSGFSWPAAVSGPTARGRRSRPVSAGQR